LTQEKVLLLNQLRDLFASYLTQQDVCILCTLGAQGAWAMPVRYRLLTEMDPPGLTLACRAPFWADGLYYLQRDARVTIIVPLGPPPITRWLQVQGMARLPQPLVSTPQAADAALYQEVQVLVHRLNLFDESQGWGVQEMLEL